MNHIELEGELKKHVLKRRIIEAIVTLLFFAVAMYFSIAYSSSRVVEEYTIGFMTYERVTYNTDLILGVGLGWLFVCYCVIIIIVDLVHTTITTIPVGEHFLTFYRGLLHVNIYVNGEYKDGLCLGYYLETEMPDNTKVTVSLARGGAAHISFSSEQASIDV